MQPPYPAPVSEWHNDTYRSIDPKRPELSQAGKTIVITGAGSGIGREVVDAFAQAGAGAIHILGRTKETLEETRGIVEKAHPGLKVSVHVADVVDASAVEQAAKEIGSWDVLVANAGHYLRGSVFVANPNPGSVVDSDADEWWKTFEINIKGSYVLARSFLLYKKTGGTIVALASGFAFLPASLPFMAQSSAYSVSKMGTARFYEFLAFENPDLNIFILQPGIIRTALYQKGELKLDDTLDTLQLPAHFSVWLASLEARPFSGRFLFANWDVEELKSKIAPRLKSDPIFLTTSLSGFPFNN